MKLKMLVVALLVAGSSIASAQSSMTVGYALQDDVSPAVQKHVNSLRVQTRLFSNVDGDLGISATTADVANTITNRYEAGLTYSQPLTSWSSAAVRAAYGYKQSSGKAEFNYYSVEPSVSIKTPVEGLSAKVGYRMRDAVNPSTLAADQNNTVRYQVAYALTKQDRIAVGYDIQRGDSANKTIALNYTRGF
jgi:hypothetical protein